MTGPRWRASALAGVFAVIPALVGCGNAGPTDVPYVTLGRDLAGVYNATAPTSTLDMRIVLGTRHTVTGRYEHPSGGIVRFQGTWERQGDRLFVLLGAQEGLPPEIVFDITRETVLTKLPQNPFSFQPENQPLFLEQDVMRLRGMAVVAGVPLELDLIRVITDVVGGGGGPTQN